ncbi:MAG TPA: LacI family DNA-binding transcriptional regulator [Chloroflexota bacterium]|nr:LacI family DNA-binding transcriptional regulator [Chloroflexota bacterium]
MSEDANDKDAKERSPCDARPPARRPPTSRDVAQRAGVSRTVVSFVLNDRPHSGIPDATRQRVLRAAAELGYLPNRAARALASGRSRQLAILVGETRNDAYGDAFLPTLLRGIDAAARAGGYRILFEYLEETSGQEALTSLRESTADGMLVWAPAPTSGVLDAFVRAGAAIVVIGDPGSSGCLSVDIDNVAAARVAVEHLLGHGYRDVAMITNVPLSFASSRARVDGYRAALRAAEIPLSADRIVPGDLDEDSGRRAMERMLTWRPLPRAVFAASDQVAIGALGALQRAGVRVPEQVALVGFDDIPLATSVHPALSTIRVPAGELGRLATRRLIEQIEGRTSEPTRVILPTSLVARRSCGCTERSPAV